HAITEVEPPIGDVDEFLPLMARMIARVPVVPGMARLLEPTTRWLREQGKPVTRGDAMAIAERMAEDILAWFGDADLVITPTVAHPPPSIGAFATLDGEPVFRRAAPLGGFPAAFNVTGQPAVSLPLAVSRTGLPIGVQLVGRPGSDRLLLALAAKLAA